MCSYMEIIFHYVLVHMYALNVLSQKQDLVLDLIFLTLWQAFEQFRQTSPDSRLKRLHYVSFEKFPLTKSDLQSAHCHWPELEKYSQALCSQWPLAIAGCHRIILADGTITLDLWFGDINILLPQTRQALHNKVDAWFLDGFAPSKNPQMWSETLFQSMADSMRENGTFATFTAAGIVKRGLQSVGFEINKIKGFGQKKRDADRYFSTSSIS